MRNYWRKGLLIGVLMVFGWFLLPVTFALEGDAVTTIFGVDLTQSLMSGVSATLTTIASMLVMFRKVRGQVSTLDKSTTEFLANLKDKLEKVANGEMTIQQFSTEITKEIAGMQTILTNAITDLKAENMGLKEEMKLIKEQFPAFVQLASDIKTSEKNIEAMLRIGFGNNPDLVANGYAKTILRIGEASPNENQG